MKTEHKKIQDRQQRYKEQFIELFSKTPIVQLVCERVGISRATYYRWVKEDSNFYAKVLASQQEGREYINDALESRLIQLAKEGNITAIIYYLKYNHPRYSDSWSAIELKDIKAIVDYLKNSHDDITQDRAFISSLFEKRLPYRVAKEILITMRQLKRQEMQKAEQTKVDLLNKLSNINR